MENLPRQVGDRYKDIRSVAKQQLVDIVAGGPTYGVGILRHDKLDQVVTDSFYWFKVKGKHSVNKVRIAYETRSFQDLEVLTSCVLKFNDEYIPETTQMRNLDIMKDNFIIFTAEESKDPAGLIASTSTPSRAPLQPKITQHPNLNPNIMAMAPPATPVKIEKPYISPYSASGIIPPTNVKTDGPQRASGPIVKNEVRDGQPGFSQYANAPNGFQSSLSVGASASTLPVKQEAAQDTSIVDDEAASSFTPEAKPLDTNERVQKLIADGSPEELEAEVKICQAFLARLRKPLDGFVTQSKDAEHWVTQIEQLQKQNVDTPTIIGVVGNTGAGKSSVINAMLEEERLVPTNCMRACTAVVTEMSYNKSNNPSELYRAHIEFIQASDWEKDLRISLKELIDASGQVSRDCSNPESEAGVAYAKIKAVYPSKTKDDLAHSSVEDLMKEECVRRVLGTTKKIEKSKAEYFYRELQSYVDSKEKSSEDKNKKKEKGEKKQMEFWPLIKVVRIYTKAEALSTGAVIVDLPGVHDSNAARAAVAQGYMKQCTGLFIVAPINRAVDDKAAKSLLGESFKRQLKFDGTYSRITFICSKTDDISITEASDSLGLEEQMSEDWEKIDSIDKDLRAHAKNVKDLRESKGVFSELINDAEEGIELWEKLKDQLDDGETVYDPSKKRKRSSEPKKSRKKAKKSRSGSDDEDDDDFIVDDDEEEEDEEDDASQVDSDSESTSDKGDPLTAEEIDTKIAQLKEDKKRARAERTETEAKIKAVNRDIKTLEKEREIIETKISAVCISGRNNYSKGAIQRDFADGIRELDMESAQEEDPDQFDPENDLRDYDEVAKSLPVFCVSSRAYQKIQGRLQRDKPVPGFRTAEETEIPQLQAHCKKLTEAGRASNCRTYLTNLSQLLNSLELWASNDGTGLNLTDLQMAAETRFLKLRLQELEQGLDKSVKDCMTEMTDALAENIFEHYDQLVELAIAEANNTVGKWHRKVDRDNRALGGYYWSTYKAIVRREGVYSNAQGPHDFNAQLTEPIIKHLASHWEKAFAQRLPRVLMSFSRTAKGLLSAFHREVEARTMKTGSGSAGVAMLGQQLKNYEQIFGTLATQMTEIINGLQREANREFTPVIARNLSSAYDYCANESGGGCFNRMKAHMSQHVDNTRGSMFAESCEEVKGLLLNMCKQVSKQMSDNTDLVFERIERDYLEVISGTRLPGQMMPKWERQMRAEVAKVIANREQAAIEDAREAAAKIAEEATEDAGVVENAEHGGRQSEDGQSRDASSAPLVKGEIADDSMNLSS